jgi:hypothetical protein
VQSNIPCSYKLCCRPGSVATERKFGKSDSQRPNHVTQTPGTDRDFALPDSGSALPKPRVTGGLAFPAAMQPRHRAHRHGQRHPSSDGPGVRTRLHVVGDAQEQATHLDGGRQLALLLKDGVDSSGILFGDDEHVGRMGARLGQSKLTFRYCRAVAPTAKRPGMTRPPCNSSEGSSLPRGLPLEVAGLLHPGGGRIPSNRAAVMENSGIRDGSNGRAQAQGGERGVSRMWGDQAASGDFWIVLDVASNVLPKPDPNAPL